MQPTKPIPRVEHGKGVMGDYNVGPGVKVLIVDVLDPRFSHELRESGLWVSEVPGIRKEDLVNFTGTYHMLVGTARLEVDREVIDAVNGLRIIGRAGTDTGNIDVHEADRRDIKVVSTQVAGVTSGELASALMSELRTLFYD